MNLNKLESQFGSYEINEITLYGVYHQYADDDFRKGEKIAVYKQDVIDKDGNEYLIVWNVLKEFENDDDTSNHCDWDDFEVYDCLGNTL